MITNMHAFDMGKDFRRFALIAGILLIVLGVAGVALPQLMSLLTAAFAGWLLVLAGFVTFYLTWQGFGGRGWLRWLKPFVLIATGLLILVYPIAGAAALGLMLAIYFMFDGFANAGMAFEMRPMRGWFKDTALPAPILYPPARPVPASAVPSLRFCRTIR